jgi:DNA-binding transcriptional regulator YiaG
MTDLANALKAEISRLARKELRAQLEPLKRSTAQSKAQLAVLREEVSALKKQIRSLEKPVRHLTDKSSEVERKSRQRFTAKGFATMRGRLGLSYAEMGRLIGASDQSVRKWEDGAAVPRSKYQQAIFKLRGVGKRMIAERLGTASN